MWYHVIRKDVLSVRGLMYVRRWMKKWRSEMEKKYRIKPEFWHLWGDGVGVYDSDVVTMSEIKNLAREWDRDVEELMEQVEEVVH